MAWFNSNWPYRQEFFIDNTGIFEDLTDFPVTINLLPASGHLFHWDLMSSPSGIDIRFANPDGQELNFEIEKCDLSKHILIAHVKIPVVSGNILTQKFYMYYGNPKAQAVSESFKSNTWNSAYAMVHHFSEKKGNYLDATQNNNDSSAIGASVDRTNVHFINNNPNFNVFNDRIDIPDSASLRDLSQITIEIMARNSVLSSANMIWSKGNYKFETVKADNKIQFTADWSTTDGRWKADSASWSSTNEEHNLAVTYDRGSTANDAIFYIDGILEPSSEQATPNGSIVSESGVITVIGNTSANFLQWRGGLDELRISNVLRSSGWIRATSRSLQGMMIGLPGAIEYASVSGTAITDWWNTNWSYRRKIYSDTDGKAYASGQHFLRFKLDVDALVSAGKLSAGYGDLRVVRQVASGQEQMPRYIASSASPAWIYFPSNYNIPSGLDIGQMSQINYYVYYGNASPASSSPSYFNFNCPQAPYSVVSDSSPRASGYYDRFLFRLNDNSGPTPEDATGHITNANAISGIVFGQTGRLDKSIYIPGTYGQFVRIPGSHFLNPSGRWIFDCWYMLHSANQSENWLFERVEDDSSPFEQWGIEVYGGGSLGTVRAKESSAVTDVSSSNVAHSGIWIYYRAIFHDTPDRRQAWVGTSGHSLTNVSQTTSFSPSISNNGNPAFIGVYMNLSEQDQGGKRFNGWVEQVRFGRFPGELAPNGISKSWISPYWVANEYTLKLETEEVGDTFTTVPIAKIGGYMFGLQPVPIAKIGGLISANTDPDFNRVGILGGYTTAQGFDVSISRLGGYINSIPLVMAPISKIGALTSGVYQKEALIGGYIIGYPNTTDYAETRARALVKADSDLAIDQSLNIDAQVIFKALGFKEFNARIDMISTDFAEFMGKVSVEKYKIPPTVQIISVTPSSGVLINGARKVTVVASGYLGDGDKWTHAYIDFGDPISNTSPLTFTNDASISGFTTNPIWTTTHDYNSSGIYSIVARAVDNLGMVGSDIYNLNLASGLVPGVDYPYLSISAIPRSGEVPDSVLISFTSTPSGVGNIKSPADQNILWNFGNRERSQLKNPKTYYHSPGLYAPTLRWKYMDKNGKIIWVSDSLLLGYNR